MEALKLRAVTPTVHWQYNIGCISFSELKELHLDSKILIFHYTFFKKKPQLSLFPKYDKSIVMPETMCNKP